MTLIQKIAATTYATIKRLQGYQLLRNPRGSNPYNVNMIKYKRGITPDMDEVFFYDRIERTFDRSFLLSNNKHLISTHIFDSENLKMSNKKNIFVYGGGIQGFIRNREDVAENVLRKRKRLSFKTRCEIADNLDLKEEKRNFFAFKSNWDFLDDFFTLGYTKQIKERLDANKPKRTSFFKTLKENLSQQVSV